MMKPGPGGRPAGPARPFIRLSAAEIDVIAAEGERLLDFAAPAGTLPTTGMDVRFAPVS